MTKAILIVDDNELQRLLLQEMCSTAGYITTCAASGAEGIKAAMDTRPDLILMDIMMPETDGLSAVKELKSNQTTACIPIIIVTAVGYEINREMAQKIGASEYITKPVFIKDLLEKIEYFTGGNSEND